MQTNSIQTINTALFVMRHFVELSSRLLPYFEKITREQEDNKFQSEQKKIEAVYESYEINPETSKLLMNSNIIALIQKGYHAIKTRSSSKDKKVYRILRDFKKEYKKLQNDWNYTTLN